MIETLHNSGFRVTTWVTPFINPRSNNLQAGLDNNYFVINGDTNQSQPVPWWRGLGYPIDFTNNKACDWSVQTFMFWVSIHNNLIIIVSDF